jgi:hypothetical protein
MIRAMSTVSTAAVLTINLRDYPPIQNINDHLYNSLSDNEYSEYS